ncbi:unnamed protein product [Cladocopium goreaui]|uniref:Cilia- and flagella-associated protein 58 central coiled coil domain-containing protein n=1 Tax=Cladocopium goreaui TaxID=2562237 RepID=A0A9P1CPF6_9DINO|nr:unnamed protein product [Cladocopium goreaui]
MEQVHSSFSKSCSDQLQNEKTRISGKGVALNEQVEQFVIEIDKLNAIITSIEKEMVGSGATGWAFHNGRAVEMRNFTGTQLIDRNDELCILWEKANIQMYVLNIAIPWLKQQEKLLKKGEVHRQLKVVRGKIPEVKPLADEVVNLREQVSNVRKHSEDLSRELENPKSSLRKWRRLGGEDLDQETLRVKILDLQERLNDKKEALLEKELILEEAGPSIMGMLTLAGIRGPWMEDKVPWISRRRSLLAHGPMALAVAGDHPLYRKNGSILEPTSCDWSERPMTAEGESHESHLGDELRKLLEEADAQWTLLEHRLDQVQEETLQQHAEELQKRFGLQPSDLTEGSFWCKVRGRVHSVLLCPVVREMRQQVWPADSGRHSDEGEAPLLGIPVDDLLDRWELEVEPLLGEAALQDARLARRAKRKAQRGSTREAMQALLPATIKDVQFQEIFFSMRSTTTTSSGHQVKAAKASPPVNSDAYEPQNQHLLVTPKQERVFGFGECVCERNKLKFPPKNLKPCECRGGECKCEAGKYLPPFARRGKVCMCRSVRGAIYNREVYDALEKRGGAVWERFESAKKAVDRNMGSHIFGKEDAKEETKPIGSIGQPPTDTFPKTPPKTPTGTPPKTPTETPRKTPETPAGTATDKALEERKEDAKGISKTPTGTPPKTPTETPRKTPETPAGTATDKALEALEERKEDAKGISKTPTGTPPKTPTEMPRKTPETPAGTATDKALEALEERKEDAKGSSKTVPRTPPGTPPKTPTETPRKLPPTRTVTELVPEEIEEDFEEDPSSPINIPAKTHPKTPTETPTRKTPKTPTEKVLEKQENAKEETSKDATRQ